MSEVCLAPICVSRVTHRSLKTQLGSHSSLSGERAVGGFERSPIRSKCLHLKVQRETTAYQFGKCVDGLFFVRAARFDGDRAAELRGEQHHSDDIACIGPASLCNEPHAAPEPRGKIRNLGRWARVNP